MDNTNGVVISELELRVSNDIDKDIENGINIDNDQNKEQNGISQENMDDEATKGSNQKEDLCSLSDNEEHDSTKACSINISNDC
ncbi:hypothetical protein K7X08_023154 [Anisodus acutangulus]|uniref:Uncharacterized protein n=1 Tax=Anisodus acutangulus TaxID=402998 RepID=A0A9Q1LEQ8_9SOLA|nr:hypothetical protein K7X08_023154 [Anisodus acutangulus]